MPALSARARPEVNDVISPADGLLIVLHHHNAVALVLQTVQRTEQARVVEGVQTDGRLVQDITHATQVRAQLGGQTQTLGLTARQRIAATIERQVAQANLLHALQAGDDFWQQRLGNGALARIEGELWHTIHRGRHREGHQIAQSLAGDAYRTRLRIQPRAMAGGAGDLSHKLFQVCPNTLAGATLQQAPTVRQETFKGAGPPAHAVPEGLLLALMCVGKGRINVDP